MPWRQLIVTTEEAGFTPSEQRILQSVQNSAQGLQTCLGNAVRMFQGALRAAYPDPTYPTDGVSVPDQLRPYVINFAVWDWLRKFPQLRAMQTDMRKQAFAEAQRIYADILTRKYGAVESPGGIDTRQNNWNSENKLIMRTHPTPGPLQQFQQSASTGPLYANPNAPSDNVTQGAGNPAQSAGYSFNPVSDQPPPAGYVGNIGDLWTQFINGQFKGMWQWNGSAWMQIAGN